MIQNKMSVVIPKDRDDDFRLIVKAAELKDWTISKFCFNSAVEMAKIIIDNRKK